MKIDIEVSAEHQMLKEKFAKEKLEQCWECSAVGPIENFYSISYTKKPTEYYCDLCIKEVKL
jgi:hypothetical protein